MCIISVESLAAVASDKTPLGSWEKKHTPSSDQEDEAKHDKAQRRSRDTQLSPCW